MILTLSVFIVLTLAAAIVLARRLNPPAIKFDPTPDAPTAFGYRMAWVAVRTSDAGRVAEVLGLGPGQAANWRTGIGTVYDERLGEGFVFVSPPLDGWTFVVGLALPQPLGRGFVDKCTSMLLDLGHAFPEAQYFISYPLLDCSAWARVADGRLLRAFAIGDEGVIWNKGRVTREERALGLAVLEARNPKARRGEPELDVIPPTEAHVMAVARGWGIDPTLLGTAAKPDKDRGTGFVCEAPLSWRPQRMRRAG